MVEQWNGIETINITEEVPMEQPDDQPNLIVSCSKNIQPQSKSSKRYKFSKMLQMKDEPFDDFYKRIQSQSNKCEFEARDRLLIYNIIVGITSDLVRKELVDDADLSLGRAIELCRKSEQPWRKLKGNDVETTNNKRRKYQKEFTAPSVYFDGNVPEIQNINEDSLRQIFRYLNLMDVVNLSKTCTRLEDFAHTNFFPQNAKEIGIVICATKILLKAPLLNTFTSELTLKNMEASYRVFYQFIEDLTFKLQYVVTPNEQAIIWRSSMTMMAQSQNLKALHYNCWSLTNDQTDELQDQIEKLEYLEELDISGSTGITNNWREANTGISKIEKLHFTARDGISTQFIDYFKNLSSLTIDFRQNNHGRADDITKMFENNGHCLENLKLNSLSELSNFSTVGRQITAKLSKLKSLELAFSLSNKSVYMIGLAHLKTLKLSCSHCTVNSILRTLSNNGYIEDLGLYDGLFVDEAEKTPPLVFDKLQSLSVHHLCRMSSFWIAMNAAQMPVLHTFDIELRERTEIYDMLKFYETKKTIKSIRLSHKRLYNDFVPFGFLKQLVQLLKKPCTPPRPFLNLNIRQLQLDNEQVITVTC